MLIGVAALTAWNLSRPTALAEAREASRTPERPSSSLTAVRRALDDLSQHPGRREAARIAALNLSRLDHARLAEPYYKLAGALNHDELHTRAYHLVRGNAREQAIQAYHDILKQWPDDALALRRLAAVLYSQAGQTAQSALYVNMVRLELVDVARRLEMIPSAAVIGYTLEGIVRHEDGDYDLAAEAFQQVLEHDPSLQQMPMPTSFFWSRLALDLIKIGQPSTARHYLDSALRKGEDPELLDTLGLAYLQEGNTAEAETAWRRALTVSGRDAYAWLSLGRLALQRGQLDDASAQLMQAAELAPNSTEALYSLAMVLRRQGRDKESARVQARLDSLVARVGQPTTLRGNEPPAADPAVKQGLSGDRQP